MAKAVAQLGVGSRQKAAVLMITLGPEVSAEVYKHLTDEEIEEITLEIANLRRVDPESQERVLEEFEQLSQAQRYIQQGGIEYARQVLEKALGGGRAEALLDRLTASLQVRPFDFIRTADPGQLLNFIQGEHPQTIALIMAYLQSEQASMILSALPPDRQADVARRIAIMDRTSPEIIKEVERVLENKLSNLMQEGSARAGGIEAVVEVLNNVDRATERTILETLGSEDPELAEAIKKRMFVFDDIVHLDDRSIQRVLREVDLNAEMPLALKVASDEVKEKIYKNMSQRAVQNLQESMEYLGPVRIRDVEDAQQRIVSIIRRLEEEGEVVIARGGEDELVV